MLKFLLAPLAAVGLALSACASVAPAPDEPAMWVVSDEDSTIYLFGTVHILKPETVWLTDRVTAAVDSADEVIFEIVVPEDEAEMMAIMMPLMLRHGLNLGTPLSERLTEEEKVKLAEALERAQLPPETAAMLDLMKPWIVALMLDMAPLEQAGYTGEAGVETILQARAIERGQHVGELETIAEQMTFIATLSDETQMQMLRDSIENIADIEEQDAVIEAWAVGDLSLLEAEVAEMKLEGPEFHEALVTRRNINWADQIEEMLEGEGVTFIAVGAGHLIGADSLQAQLKARGIQAVRK